jgi:hypothetical protein
MKNFLDWLAIISLLTVVIGLMTYQVMCMIRMPEMIIPVLLIVGTVILFIWALNRIRNFEE